MAIRLKWKNPNTGATVVRIYRSLTSIDTSAPMPAPIVEITDGSTSYLDEFPKYGESYYYVFSVIVNGRELFTPNKYYSCVIDLGPGPKDIIVGDFKMGYFGMVSIGDLGFSSTIYGPGVSLNNLYKIARNGKIIYAPLAMIATTINNLKDAKALTSGVTAKNDPFAGAAGMVRDIGGRLFAIRVAKFWDDTNSDVTLSNYNVPCGNNFPSAVITPLGKSELIDLVRLARPANSDIPARFSLGTDAGTGLSSNSFLTSCDFASATSAHAVYNLTGTTTAAAPAFTTTTNFYPVIEYKGIA